MSIEEFYGLFTRTTRQLASMVPKSSPGCIYCTAKEKHDEQMLMFCFVMGLRQEFELCRSQLLGCVPLPTLDEALGAVIADETRLRSLAVSHTTPLTHSGVLASQQRGNIRGSSPSSGVICSHCKKSGHTVDQCFALHPELLIEFRKRNPGHQQQYCVPARRSSTAAVTESDSSAKCASVSAASQSTSGNTPTWYLDSG